MRNKRWEFSSVATWPLEILMAEVAAGVITGHSTADLFWKCETKYRGRKTVRGRIGNTENQKMDKTSVEMATGTSGPLLSCSS